MQNLVIVKGDRCAAARAAAARGIPLVFDRETNYGNTVGRTMASAEKLNAWFVADSGREAPYPAGSLLWWRPLEVARESLAG